MLFKSKVLDGIAAGSITLAFRRWKRPTVKAGGTLLTPVGVLAIEDVVAIDPMSITNREAAQAGYETTDALGAELASRPEGTIYKIRFTLVGEDPRLALRADNTIGEEELAGVLARLEKLDREAPWTECALALIARYPGRRAAELAVEAGEKTAAFKQNIRKLKNLGLTESLRIGYALSPRGRLVQEHLAKRRRARQVP